MLRFFPLTKFDNTFRFHSLAARAGWGRSHIILVWACYAALMSQYSLPPRTKELLRNLLVCSTSTQFYSPLGHTGARYTEDHFCKRTLLLVFSEL